MFDLQWDLVCNRDYLAELSQTLFQVGGLIGELFLTTMVDRLGRRPVHLIGLVATTVIGCAVALSQNYIMYAVLRLLLCIVIMVSELLVMVPQYTRAQGVG